MLARLRLSTHPLIGFTIRCLTLRDVLGQVQGAQARISTVPRCSNGRLPLAAWNWTSSNPALTISRESCGSAVSASSLCYPLFRHAIVPSLFQAQVSRLTQRIFSESLPNCVGVNCSNNVAHIRMKRAIRFHDQAGLVDCFHEQC